eukprot:g5077.t1
MLPLQLATAADLRNVALQLHTRQKRQSGSPDKNHTFKPQLISNTESATSKLPPGARVGDASAKPGTYDLTVLDTMDDAFPPKRTTSNIYRENRYDQDGVGSGRDKGPMEFGGAGDSLDHLAGGAADRQILSRHGSSNGYGNRRRRSTSGEEAEDSDRVGRWTGPTREREISGAYDDCYGYYDPAVKPNGVGDGVVGRAAGRNRHPGAAAASDDALSHEVEQRPQVRGSISQEQDDGDHHRVHSLGGAGGDDGLGRRRGGAGTVSKRAGRQNDGCERDEPDHDLPLEWPRNHDPGSTRCEDAVFLESLRGGEGGAAGEGAGAGAHRKGGNPGPGSCPSNGKQRARMRHARRPEWNSDTANVASLGGGQAAILTENSPAAVQARIESSSKRKSSNNVIADSPYAAGGTTNTSTSKNNHSAHHNNSNGSSDAAWKHKHTKTLPWGEDGVVGVDRVGGSGDGSYAPDADARRHDGGFGREATVDRLADERTEGGRGGRAREGYRLQMMPSPSTGSLTLATEAKTMYRGGGRTHEREHPSGIAGERGRGIPAEKEQLRRNLSLLKKKMHSQAGSRRSQSAGPRAGDLFGDPSAPSDAGYPDSQHGGARQHLHMTTGTAPAMMSASPGTFLRDRETAGTGTGRRGTDGARGRPPHEGPGSPYAVDPIPNLRGTRDAAARVGARPNQHRQSPPQRRHRQQHQQASSRAPGSHGRTSNRGDFPQLPGDDAEAATQATAIRREGGQRFALGYQGSPRSVTPGRGAPASRGSRNALGGRGADTATLSGGRHRGGRGGGISSGQSSPDRRRAWEAANGGGDRGGVSSGKGEGGGEAREGDGGGFADELPPDAFPDRPVELQECKMCGRRFTSAALEKHSRACQKVFLAKGKVFNAAEMRIKGTELEKFAKSKSKGSSGGAGGNGRGGKTRPRGFDDTPVGGVRGAKSSKWRQQSKQFRDALRQARVVTDAQKSGKSLADLPPPQPSAPDPSFVPCPHCGRSFSAVAGERHIPHCKNIKAKPSVLKKGSGSLLGHAARKSSSRASGRGNRQRW